MRNPFQGIAFRFIYFIAAVTLAAAPAVAQEDSGNNSISVTDGPVSEIPAMTIPNVVLDFDAMPAGNTTVGAIQAAFPGSALSNLFFTTRADTGTYDSQTGGGRALAAADIGGTLTLIDPPLGVYQNADALTIVLVTSTTEVGFEIGDWAGPFNVNFFDGAAPVGSIQVSTLTDDRDHFVQSGAPFDTIVLTANPDNPPANWTVPALHLPQFGTPGRTTFLVSKDFEDNNPAEVEVTLSCNTGLPLEQTTSISAGDPVNFVITDFEDGTLDCEVTEVVPDGYEPSYDNGTTVSAVSCEYEDIDGTTTPENFCAITNDLDQVRVDVTKVWIDENPQFNAVNIAEANWSCSNVAHGQSSGFLQFFGNPDTESFFVFPDWDGGTTCAITEVNIPDGGVEVDDSDCSSIVVFPGSGGSCEIVNTRLFEGIPTLSRHGLAILALLMLGIGFVGFRRYG